MVSDVSSLFQPYRLGDLDLPNRVVMAPLTRNRAVEFEAPSDMAALYYRQRASAGLIISEATQISQQGQGYAWTPGLFSEAQVEGWRKVTGALHGAGGRIFAQLWHVGRISHASLQPNGGAPVAPSAIMAKSRTFIESGFVEVSAPRALALSEIAGVVEDYVKAASNAKRAGFDGIEIHAANGYLIDQFLRDGTNKREDAYGGSIENRTRFALEVVDAILKVWPAARVGIRIAPVSPANDISDSNPAALFGHLVSQLNERRLVYIHVVEGATQGDRNIAPFDYMTLRKAFSGAYMANNGYTRELAVETLTAGRADLIAFGRPFIANPDLVERLRRGAPYNELDAKTLFGGGEKGYIDYPALKEA